MGSFPGKCHPWWKSAQPFAIAGQPICHTGFRRTCWICLPEKELMWVGHSICVRMSFHRNPDPGKNPWNIVFANDAFLGTHLGLKLNMCGYMCLLNFRSRKDTCNVVLANGVFVGTHFRFKCNMLCISTCVLRETELQIRERMGGDGISDVPIYSIWWNGKRLEDGEGASG